MIRGLRCFSAAKSSILKQFRYTSEKIKMVGVINGRGKVFQFFLAKIITD